MPADSASSVEGWVASKVVGPGLFVRVWVVCFGLILGRLCGRLRL